MVTKTTEPDEPPISETPIKDFINSCRTTGTQKAYRTGIILFLTHVYGEQRTGKQGKATDIIKATQEDYPKYETLAVRYLREKRNHTQDVINYIQTFRMAKAPSMTIKIRQTAIRQFLQHYEITFSDVDRKKITRILPQKAYTETNFDFITVEKLQNILPLLNVSMKALILTLACSGARIHELLNLKKGDLHIEERPYHFFIRYESAETRRAYVTEEAREALKVWLLARDAYANELSGVSGTKFHKNKKSDDRVFPFSDSTVYDRWEAVLIKAGYFRKDAKTKRNTMSIHRLRAFFRRTIGKIIDNDRAELLMGHTDAYGNTYRDVPEEDLAEAYAQCEEALTIQSNRRIEHDLRAQGVALKEQTNELIDLRARLQQLMAENQELKHAQAQAPAPDTIKVLQDRLTSLENLLKAVATSQKIEQQNEKGFWSGKAGDTIVVESDIQSVGIGAEGRIVTKGGKTRKYKIQ
jgi:integrase